MPPLADLKVHRSRYNCGYHAKTRQNPMDSKIVKGPHHNNKDTQCKMSDAEVMSTSIVAAVFFGGNKETTQIFWRSSWATRFTTIMAWRI